MEANKNGLIQLGLGIVLLSLVGGCATSRKSQSTDAPVSAEAPGAPAESGSIPGVEQKEMFGPPTPELYGPAPVRIKPVVLVFGPGLARGYAYVGVIRSLHENKIRIGAVLGSEMGGLMAALYGVSSNLNQFEWGLLKLKEDGFGKKRGFFSAFSVERPDEGQLLEAELRQLFEEKDLSALRVPVQIVVQSASSGESLVLTEGNIASIVRGAVAVPGMLTPGTLRVSGKPTQIISAASSRAFLIAEAKKLGIGPVIVVDVLAAETTAITEELKEADLVIRPVLKGIGYHDFGKRNEIAFKGKSATNQQIKEIRHLVGIEPGTAQGTMGEEPRE